MPGSLGKDVELHAVACMHTPECCLALCHFSSMRLQFVGAEAHAIALLHDACSHEPTHT